MSLRSALLLSLVSCLLHAPLHAQSSATPLPLGLAAPGCEVLDTRLQKWPVRSVRARAGENGPALALDPMPVTEPPLNGLRQLHAIIWAPATPQQMGSQPTAIEMLDLGSVGADLPPPPDWQRSHGDAAPWQRGAAVAQPRGQAFLPGAVVCWLAREDAATTSGFRRNDPRLVLARQAIAVADAKQIGSAVLHIACSTTLREGSWNEVPLAIPPGAEGQVLSYDVTSALRAGTNIVALKLAERDGGPRPHDGLAFRLDLYPALPDAAATPPGRGLAQVSTYGPLGGGARGGLLGIDAAGVLLASGYGNGRVAVHQLTSVHFSANRDAGMLRSIGLGNADANTSPQSPALLAPINQPEVWRGKTLLAGGEVVDAQPSRIEGSDVVLTGGHVTKMQPTDLLAWYPAPDADETTDAQHTELPARAVLRDGNVLQGTVRALSARQLRLGLADLDVNLPVAQLARVEFPAHGPQLNRLAGAANQLLLAPPLTADSGPQTAAWMADLRAAARGAADAVGAGLQADDVPALLTLDPARTRLVLLLYPGGQYIRTVNTPGDAEDALLNYIEAGGHVLALSHGGALRKPLRAEGAALVPEVEAGAPTDGDGTDESRPTPAASPTLADRLKLRRLKPGDAPLPVGRAFMFPPNTGGALGFVLETRRAEFTRSLPELPRVYSVPIALRPHYQPVLTDPAAQSDALYTLRMPGEAAGGRDEVLGPGLTLVRRGRGVLILVDHLLWQSASEQGPFTETILPQLLRWSLEIAPR